MTARSLTIAPAIFLPNAIRLASEKLELYEVEHFMSDDECDELIATMQRAGLQRSTITTEDTEPDKKYRTSKTCHLSYIKDSFVGEIDNRICRYIGINPTYSERIQAQLYDVGEQFKAHTDYFQPNTTEYERFAGRAGQRTWTFMIYLNDVERGGGTRFVSLNHTIRPERGKAVIWNSLYATGDPNPDTLHHGMPVEQGYKAIITKWFRAQGQGEMFTKESNEYIPNYTTVGFQKNTIPTRLFSEIREFYETNRRQTRREDVSGFVINRTDTASELIELPKALRVDIHHALQPICERWSGKALEPTYVYGIRRYLHGTSLKVHRDRSETHIISAILNVDQRVNSEWPLIIDDNYYRTHRLNLAPGEMVLYEGGRLNHGRPEPLDGDYFCNISVHFKPTDYVPVALPAELAADLVPGPAPGWALEEDDQGTVLVKKEAGLRLQCNQITALVWSLCDGKRSVAEIIELLTEAFPDAASRIADDVKEVLVELVNNGVVRVH